MRQSANNGPKDVPGSCWSREAEEDDTKISCLGGDYLLTKNPFRYLNLRRSASDDMGFGLRRPVSSSGNPKNSSTFYQSLDVPPMRPLRYCYQFCDK